MSIYHDEVEIEDMEYDEELEMYYFPCPCGDQFQISKVRTTRTHTPTIDLHALRKRETSRADPNEAVTYIMGILQCIIQNALKEPYSKHAQ